MAVTTSPTLRARLLEGETLPASWYSDPEILQLEEQRIFGRSWHYAGPLEQVAEPGSFFTCRAGATPIVVVRGRDGRLRALVNVCRHRGHEVASGCGRRETLQCPYHAWTYDLDGSLRAAPRSDREPGFDASQLGLRAARVETWEPLVFVSPDADAPPFGEILGDLPEQLIARGVDPTRLVYRGRSREQVLEANWKIVVENFLECYHCPTAHKSFSRLIDVDPDTYALETGRWTSSQYGPARTGDGLPYDPTGEISGSQFHYIWPDWTINVLPGPPHLRVIVFQPLTPDLTASYVDGYWAPEVSDSVIQEINEFGAEVGKEDRELVESVHRGLRSGAIDHGRLLVGSERLIQHFQLLVHDALAGAL